MKHNMYAAATEVTSDQSPIEVNSAGTLISASAASEVAMQEWLPIVDLLWHSLLQLRTACVALYRYCQISLAQAAMREYAFQMIKASGTGKSVLGTRSKLSHASLAMSACRDL